MLHAQQIPDVELIVKSRIVENVSHCSIKQLEKPLFYVTDTSDPSKNPWFENLRTQPGSDANLLGQVAIGAMIRVGPTTESNIGTSQYVYSQVLRHSPYRSKLSSPTKGSVRGYLFGKSIDAPEKWQFLVRESFIEQTNNSSDAKFLNDKILIAAKDNRGYHTIVCETNQNEISYPVFAVFEENVTQPIAFIAARPEDMGFLKSYLPSRNRSEAFINGTIELETEQIFGASAPGIQGSHSKNSDSRMVPQPRPNLQSQPIPSGPTNSPLPEARPEQLANEAPHFSPPPKNRPNQAEEEEEAKNFIDHLTFPLVNKPTHDFQTGIRRFGSGRGSRLHAGVDLYRPVGDPILSIANGIVIRVAPFDFSTQQIEIKNQDGSIYRYTELKAKVKKGDSVRVGQPIASVQRLRGISRSMLHIEMYTGNSRGNLTQIRRQPYKRRDDLVNPTQTLVRLARKNNFL